MPSPQAIIDFDSELASKLDAIESACIARDAIEQANEDATIPPATYEWTPSVPAASILINAVSVWLNRPEEIKRHKNVISSMFVNMKRIGAQKNVFEKFMKDTGVDIPKEFYTTSDILTNYKLGNSFDVVFTCSGFFAYLKGLPNSHYATDDGVTDATTDVDTYYTGDTNVRGREWLRAEDERDKLAYIIGNHADYIIDESGISLDSVLKTDEDFASKYNSF